MENKKIINISLIIVTVIFAVVGFIFLPNEVIIQFSVSASGVNKMPKLLAILIPFALGIGGAIMDLTNKDSEKPRGILISLVGVLLFIIMLVVNCIF